MSKYMQIRVRIESMYRHSLKDHFPNITRCFEREGVNVGGLDISLYRMIDEVEKILFKDHLDRYFKAVLERYKEGLFNLRNEVEQNMASWRLSLVDHSLYKIEDLFEEIERDLM